MYFLCPKNSIRGLKMSFPVIFRFISEIFVFEHFHSTKRFVFEFQGESLKLFFKLSCSFPPLSPFWRILAVYCQLVPWLLNLLVIWWKYFFSGKYIDCNLDYVPGRAAMGRCSTSRNISAGGDCGDDRSHGVRCCETEYIPDSISCGWTFASYGVKLNCPAGFAATGYCGVNNKGDCIGDNFLGINCCKFKPR